MSKWFRSAEMDYVSIIVNEDAAHSAINDLGMLGIIQFTDLNHEQVAFQRRYVSYIKRCDELERKLRYIRGEINKFHMDTEVPGGYQRFISQSTGAGKDPRSGASVLQQLEQTLEKYEQQLLELNSLGEKMTREFNEKSEFNEVLHKVQELFATEGPRLLDDDRERAQSHGSMSSGDNARPLLPASEIGVMPVDKDMRFSFMAGTIIEEDRPRFERMLFRATKGNVYARFAEVGLPLTDPVTGELKKKEVFIIFYKSPTIERKISKICDAFAARRYPIPDIDDASKVREVAGENAAELNDARVVLQKNKDARYRLCKELASKWEDWMWTVVREKSIYHTLNNFKSDVSGMLRGEGWIVSSALPKARAAITDAHSRFESSMPSLLSKMPKPWPTPPTYYETNKFTWAFQEFVDTYGVPRYREANPALFTAATFPFLFGIMYGDMGHGFCLTMLGLYLVITEAKAEERGGGAMKSLYPARYMLLLMGVFAMYSGLIYNDYFALPINFFGSRWAFVSHDEGQPAVNKYAYGSYDSVYPIGVDPAWHISQNSLLFLNSMKMKLSVILGIVHMTWGIILRGCNAVYFKQWTDFIFEFLPMIIFDLALFGYMVILIFIKWSIDWNQRMLSATCEFNQGGVWVACPNATVAAGGNCFVHGRYPSSGRSLPCTPGVDTTVTMCPLNYGGTGDGCQPPNLINTLISIALTPGSVVEPMFAGQASLQVFLLLLAFGTVPILLCGKPLIVSGTCSRKKGHEAHHAPLGDDPEDLEHPTVHTPSHDGPEAHGGEHEEHSLSELFIHQTIETIEFVLGMVSNTASYLRLWALSLAHSQLSEVFWEKALLGQIEGGNPFFVFVGFAVFAAVTFGVILAMDVLECFLHALRLHWVEFQNKFYKADGYKFSPLNIPNLCKKVITG